MQLTKSTLVDLWNANSYGLSDSVKLEILKPTGKNGTFVCRDYQVAIAFLSAARKFSSVEEVRGCGTIEELRSLVPIAYQYRLGFYTPCLAYRYNELKDSEKDELFDDPKWVFTQKLDGCRAVFVVHNGVPYLFGRTFSCVDSSMEDTFGNFGIKLDCGWMPTTSVDMEITCDAWRWLSDILFKLFNIATYTCSDTVDSFMHLSMDNAALVLSSYNSEFSGDLFCFNVILPLYYHGHNYIGRKISESFKQIDSVVSDLRTCGLNAKRVTIDGCTRDSKLTFLKTMLSLGFEGVVAYNMDAPYVTTESRCHKTFVKIKSGWDSDKSLGDTIDAYVSGLRMSGDLIVGLELSIDVSYSGGVRTRKLIAVCNKMTAGLVHNPTYHSSDVRVADATFIGRVAEIESSGYSVGTKLLVKPHIRRWRYDKTPDECVYTIESLKLMFG